MFTLQATLRLTALSLIMFVSTLAVGQDTIAIKKFDEVKTLLDSFSNAIYASRFDRTSRHYAVDSVIVDSVNAHLDEYRQIYHDDFNDLIFFSQKDSMGQDMRGIGLGDEEVVLVFENKTDISVDVFIHLGDVVYSWATVAFLELSYNSQMRNVGSLKEVKIYLSGKD